MSLPKDSRPGDPEPTWHQVAELPPMAAVVTEHQGHGRRCGCCGRITHEPIPPDVLRHVLGPRLSATMSYLSGRCHDGRRLVQEIVHEGLASDSDSRIAWRPLLMPRRGAEEVDVVGRCGQQAAIRQGAQGQITLLFNERDVPDWSGTGSRYIEYRDAGAVESVVINSAVEQAVRNSGAPVPRRAAEYLFNWCRVVSAEPAEAY